MKAKYAAVGIGIAGVLVATHLIAPEWFGLCSTHNRGDGVMVCSSPYEARVGDPLAILASTFSLISAIMLLASKRTFWRWIKFSIAYAIIVTIFLVTIPEIGYGFGGFGLTLLSTQGLAMLYATLYGLISLVLLAVSEWSERLRKSP